MPSKRVSEKEVVASSAISSRRKPATTRVKRTVPIAVSTAPVTEPVQNSPSREQIASLAYSYWVERGYQGGSPEEDWLRAEQELASQPSLAAAVAATA